MESKFRLPTIQEICYAMPSPNNSINTTGTISIFETGGKLSSPPVVVNIPKHNNLSQPTQQEAKHFENIGNYVNKNWKELLCIVIIGGIVYYYLNKSNTEKEKKKCKNPVALATQSPPATT